MRKPRGKSLSTGSDGRFTPPCSITCAPTAADCPSAPRRRNRKDGMFRNLFANLRRFWDRVQPGFWRRMRPSYRAASAITILVAVWLGSGILGGAAKHSDDAETKANEIPSVQVQRLAAIRRDASI